MPFVGRFTFFYVLCSKLYTYNLNILMRKRLLFAFALLSMTVIGFAQQPTPSATTKEELDESEDFIFNETQLDDDADESLETVVVGSNSNLFANKASFRFTPLWYRSRALDSRNTSYIDTYINGVQVNGAENGRFNYGTSFGYLSNATSYHEEKAMPFEDNTFGISTLGGTSNYDLRAGGYAAGHKITLSGANRNYRVRAMYTFATGMNAKGWAFMGTVSYRWANEGYIPGTFYNSASYFLTLQKVFNPRHSLNIATWGSPTERAQNGASTDEAYWLANDRMYNPYWGYQDGKKRNSRVVNSYEPTLLVTWDYNINDRMKLTTSLYTKYTLYNATRLQYNNSFNPAPDYWKNFPSYAFNVWGDADPTDEELSNWNASYNHWTADKANRQIQWDELYFANQQMNSVGGDAAYYILKRHNNHFTTNLGSTLKWDIDNKTTANFGIQLASNKGMHYQTISDMMGATTLHNINNYAVGNYVAADPHVQYDLNNPNATVGKGDRFGFDYNLVVQKASLWAQYTKDSGISHNFIAGHIGGKQMWRDGKMRNGMAADYSYGKSKTARFLEGGGKIGTTLNFGRGHVVSFGASYDVRSPQASVAFESPEMNNNFVDGLKMEHIASAELNYNYSSNWFHATLNAYFNHATRLNEWSSFYYDDVNSFTYVSLTGAEKNYYGAELALDFRVTNEFSIDLVGAMSEAKYTKNTDVTYMLSTEGTTKYDICYNKGMRESGTPLTIAGIGLEYRWKGFVFNLKGNYYDRIYLSYAPSLRYGESLRRSGNVNNDGTYNVPEQAKGNGGFMLDGAIRRTFKVAGHPLVVNLMLTNILNNRNFVSNGFEQSRSSYTTDKATGEVTANRTYDFQKNPKKYYVQGFNFLLNLTYRF